MKSEKWAPRALRWTLVGYDGHTIYRVQFKDQKRVIRVKDFQIFEDYKTEKSTKLLENPQDLATFQGFLQENSDDEELELSVPCAGRKFKSTRKGEQELSVVPCAGQKVISVKEEKQSAR